MSALTFGSYPGSAIGTPGPAGPPGQPDQINHALGRLRGSGDIDGYRAFIEKPPATATRARE